MTILLAGMATFAFTTVLTIAGVGAAFILIPVFLFLGVDLRTAMGTALLLNAVSMAAACVRFVRARLVDFPTAVPILAVAVPLAPLGTYTSRYLPVVTLKWLFVGFLLSAGTLVLEVVGGILSGSLALLSDAVHVLLDLLSLLPRSRRCGMMQTSGASHEVK